jgi:uncharacterized protein (TIGR03437 family)
MRFKLIGAVLAALPVTLFAFHLGPPIKRTGNIDGGLDCTACHNSFAPANSDPSGSVTLENLQPYVPGVPQNLRVRISHPTAARWGFQLTARFVNGGGRIMAGSFTPIDNETKVVCDNGSTSPLNTGDPGPCSAEKLAWIEHADAPRGTPGQGHVFAFQWTPPADENGDIVFYLAGNAANGDGSNRNDHIYTTTVRIQLSTDSACPLTRMPQPRSAVNAGAHAGPFSWNSMVEIYGSDFQSGSRNRSAGPGDFVNGRFPDSLSCIAVEINGQRAPVTYVQADQINVQAPTITTTGPVTLRVIANPGKPNEMRSSPATVTMQSPAPAFFTFGSSKSIAAQIEGTADVVADPAVVPGGRPAKPGEWVTLYGTGFGNTNPVWQAGEIPTAAAPLSFPFTVSIGGTILGQDDVQYGGLSPQSISALYQFNVRIPASTPDGDVPVVITVNGVKTQEGATIPVKRQ